MTGYGRATGVFEGEGVAVELSAVNHRFLECTFRLPYAWNALEPALRETVKRHVARGKVNVSVRRERGPSGKPVFRFDEETAREYIAASRSLSGLMNSTDALSLDRLMTLEGVFYQEEEDRDLDTVVAAITGVLEQALGQFNATREKEGEALAADIRQSLNAMRESLASVEGRLPEISSEYENRIRARLVELNAEVGVKEDRVAVELAMMAEKADVNEEVVRLKAHFDRLETLLVAKEPIGRELNFLAQEFQREMNTLGSKLRDIGVTQEVVRMKIELEKMREQAQNIE